MSQEVVNFARLGKDGKVEGFRSVDKADIVKCPFLILMPEHYRQDGSCRCWDPTAHEQMEAWGYTWGDGQWEAPK